MKNNNKIFDNYDTCTCTIVLTVINCYGINVIPFVSALTWAPEGKRRQGRPRNTCRRTVEKEREEFGWNSWRKACCQRLT